MNPDALFRALTEAGVRFVVIGGLAAVLQGVPYVTNDIDLCYETAPDNVAKLVRLIAPLHPYLRVGGLTAEEARLLPFQWDERTLRDSPNVTLQTDVGDLDLLTTVPGVGAYDDVRAASSLMEIAGVIVSVLDLPALIISKQVTNRPKDRLMLPLVEATLQLRELESQSDQ